LTAVTITAGAAAASLPFAGQLVTAGLSLVRGVILLSPAFRPPARSREWCLASPAERAWGVSLASNTVSMYADNTPLSQAKNDFV
jgi:hypothetical protein